jgi:thioester reductase-like protein
VSATLGVGVSFVAFFVGFIGEHRINRERLDKLQAEVTALQRADHESALDRRSLSERLSHVETSRIAPARGRE